MAAAAADLLLGSFRRIRTLTLPVRRFSSLSAASSGGGVSVKRVTQANFSEAEAELADLVRQADFVAFDLEMTGVTSAPWRASFECDSTDVLYLKVRDSAEKFAMVQLGLCPFRWDAARAAFVAHPHSFFVFPRKQLRLDAPCDEFLCQTTSMDFLAKNQFDFNTCIREGISYLSRAEEAAAAQKLSSACREKVAATICGEEPQDNVPTPRTADVFFMERMKIKFKDWHDKIWDDQMRSSNMVKESKFGTDFEMVFFKMCPAVMLHGFTSHQLKLIQLVLKKHFDDLTYVSTFGNDGTRQNLVVYTNSNVDKASLLKEVQESILAIKESEIKHAIGIRRIIDQLASERKLIIGYSCFLDIAHLHSKFLGPLPSSIEEFSRVVHENFPYIIDTKHVMDANQAMQNMTRPKGMSLSSVFSLLCPAFSSMPQISPLRRSIKIEVPSNEKGSSSYSGAKHEAGYDAFMTGCVFAQLCNRLGINFDMPSPRNNLALNTALEKYANLLNPSWASANLLDLPSCTMKPKPNIRHRYPKEVVYENTVLIYGFSSHLKAIDIKNSILKTLGRTSVTSVFALDSSAALIQFDSVDSVNKFLALKSRTEQMECDLVSVLHPLAALVEGGKTQVVNYDTYRDICRSALSKVLFADQAEAVCSGVNNEYSSEIVSVTDSELKCESLGRNLDLKNRSVGEITCDDILECLYKPKYLFNKAASA